MFYEDWRGVKKLLAKAKTLCDQGGDWERKNKLKVAAKGRRQGEDADKWREFTSNGSCGAIAVGAYMHFKAAVCDLKLS